MKKIKSKRDWVQLLENEIAPFIDTHGRQILGGDIVQWLVGCYGGHRIRIAAVVGYSKYQEMRRKYEVGPDGRTDWSRSTVEPVDCYYPVIMQIDEKVYWTTGEIIPIKNPYVAKIRRRGTRLSRPGSLL